jgi:hypothetical protein
MAIHPYKNYHDYLGFVLLHDIKNMSGKNMLILITQTFSTKKSKCDKLLNKCSTPLKILVIISSI